MDSPWEDVLCGFETMEMTDGSQDQPRQASIEEPPTPEGKAEQRKTKLPIRRVLYSDSFSRYCGESKGKQTTHSQVMYSRQPSEMLRRGERQGKKKSIADRVTDPNNQSQNSITNVLQVNLATHAHSNRSKLPPVIVLFDMLPTYVFLQLIDDSTSNPY